MAFSFFGFAAYVTFESVRSLTTGHEPDASVPLRLGSAGIRSAAGRVLSPRATAGDPACVSGP